MYQESAIADLCSRIVRCIVHQRDVNSLWHYAVEYRCATTHDPAMLILSVCCKQSCTKSVNCIEMIATGYDYRTLLEDIPASSWALLGLDCAYAANCTNFIGFGRSLHAWTIAGRLLPSVFHRQELHNGLPKNAIGIGLCLVCWTRRPRLFRGTRYLCDQRECTLILSYFVKSAYFLWWINSTIIPDVAGCLSSAVCRVMLEVKAEADMLRPID